MAEVTVQSDKIELEPETEDNIMKIELLEDVEGLGDKGDRVSHVDPERAKKLIEAGKAKDLRG